MKISKHIIANGNQAVAHIAYKANEVCVIYPITPASQMSELVEEWSANMQENIFGDVPDTFEMQSEAGVAGAMHGALQTGALTTTFTASQGLLLMMPNMYKIAGELTPNVIHVATRSVATHALSIFGDHSDIMAARNTGYAFLGSSSVQEAMDFALISQASTLTSRIPFVHFFDGFRTSHETTKIEEIDDHVIRTMINDDFVSAHKNRALNPNNPIIRGTSQGPDVFFQSRETVNSYYNACPDIVQDQMNKFTKLTGRAYKIFDYIGHPRAEQVIIAMASATETIEETINYLNKRGEKIGLVKVRLFRPFSIDHFIKSIPKTCKNIAVLDRTKEPGSTGEPLYLDVVQSLMQTINTHTFYTFPRVVGGRYGLASKEFTPAMVRSIVENLKSANPKNNFTVGITDDLTGLSLKYNNELNVQHENYQALFYETRNDSTQNHFNRALDLLGANPDHYVQGYMECDYKKSNARSVSHLRISKKMIKAPYLIKDADFVGCDSINFLRKETILQNIKPSGVLLVHSELESDDFWKELSVNEQKLIQAKEIALHIVNLGMLNEKNVINDKSVSVMHACHLALNDELNQGFDIESARRYLRKVNTSQLLKSNEDILIDNECFSETLLGKLLSGKGNELPVSLLPVDGTFTSDTSRFNVRDGAIEIPQWNPDLCTQCGACSMACPQGAIRIKAYDNDTLLKAPSEFKSDGFLEDMNGFDLLNFTVQANPEQCTSCNICVDACPAKALVMTNSKPVIKNEKENWNFFETIPEFDRTKIDVTQINQQQLQEPLFKYAMGVDGCGEAPYLKLASQLFGDRMVVANATGASSIFGGALPTTPWAKNKFGMGPAWSNSLFEDNAEFGLGYRLSLDQQEIQAQNLLEKLTNQLDFNLVQDVLNAKQTTELEISQQRNRVKKLKIQLSRIQLPEAKRLLNILDCLVKKSVWIVGGDGWAYDIGYGGLDHVLASGKNVNILVLDNEVYSNTGGQMSKATPFGASAKFAAKGKQKQKKDLGLLAAAYEDVYVASVAIGADQNQTLKAFVEAEQHDGPSIIIAYCHSPAHGIDMKNPSRYHKAAVASGQWLLYRNDPIRIAKGFSPMQLDSDEPTIPIQDYLKLEKRFDMLFNNGDEIYKNRVQQAQNFVDNRYRKYKFMSLPYSKQSSKFRKEFTELQL
ncbi:pyruvate:ferredoxin (flavodoxin) oxidoreductase [Flagellimonas aquimarina]|uniref:Pyruvate:ferredoxin (Flavodoxin) oxidoreductase n=1 Tax=Flagellimonas aquimarina TaxID=2201895 RepID=A0A316KXN4_9FLAO|nr:4Fe-4S binding protein [Allomuricauda koreensis]PWL38426.1 pyruvate:ferredoxin (flavodoxin) oxidoreductase [Allomuricauda koreensis]